MSHDVRRVALALQQMPSARELAPHALDVAREAARVRVDVGAVVEEPVVARRAEQPLAHPPVRRPAELAPRRDVEDRPVEILEAVLAHHAGRVDDLGREDLRVVAVAGAVAPARARGSGSGGCGARSARARSGTSNVAPAASLRVQKATSFCARRDVAVLVERERRRRAGVEEPRDVRGLHAAPAERRSSPPSRERARRRSRRGAC